MYQIFYQGKHYSTGAIPRTISGCKLSNIQSASPEQWKKHDIEVVLYTPPEPEPLTPEELAQQFKQDCMDALQARLDETARQYGFESIHTAIAWGADRPYGAELKAWGKACWEKAEEIQAAVLAGGDPPESVDAFLAEMPEWGVA